LSRWPHGDPNAVVRDVLAGPAYRHAAATAAVAPPQSPLDVAWNWIVDHVIAPLLAPIARALGSSRDVGTAAGIATIALAVALLAYVVYRLALRTARPQRTHAAHAPTPLGTARDALAWRALARAAAGRGDFAGAIAALFAAALATLDERAIVAFDPARTPGEYRRLVRRERVAAADAFDELASAFVRARFAPQPPDAASFGAAVAAYERFEPATTVA